MMTLVQLAVALGADLHGTGPGDPEKIVVERVAGATDARPTDIVFAEDAAALALALASHAAAVLVTHAQASGSLSRSAEESAPLNKPLLLHSQPRLAFARAAVLLRARPAPTGVHPTAVVAATAVLGEGISIGPCAIIGGHASIGTGVTIGSGAVVGECVTMGDDCHIYPRVVLYPGTRLGARVIVHAGAVLGADGFGYVRDASTGQYIQFPQQGRLVIEDDVEIGANTTIDRGALEETRIGRGTKIDNLVHIAHNVVVGRNVVIASQTGISGSTRIGDGAIFGGQVGIGDHAEVGKDVVLGGQAGVLPHKSLQGPGQLFWGTPAKPVKTYLRELATLSRLVRRSRVKE